MSAIYPIPGSGTDKHHGKYMSHITFPAIFDASNVYGYGASKSINIFGWSRMSASGSVEVKENTNAGSKTKTYQVMREEPPTAEIEFYLPYNEDGPNGAKALLRFIRAGVLIDNTFNINDTSGANPLFSSSYFASFGRWIVQSSSIQISRDDLSSVRATVKALGYTNAEVDWS